MTNEHSSLIFFSFVVCKLQFILVSLRQTRVPSTYHASNLQPFFIFLIMEYVTSQAIDQFLIYFEITSSDNVCFSHDQIITKHFKLLPSDNKKACLPCFAIANSMPFRILCFKSYYLRL